MKFAFLTKRYYTNKDILDDRFGRLFHLPSQMAKLGHEGLVITGDLHTGRDERREIGGLEFYSKPFSLFALPGFIGFARKLLKTHDVQVLVASGDSYWGFMGGLLARNLGIPFVFDVYDDYTAWKANKFPGMKAMFRAAVRNADLLVASGPPIADFLRPLNSSIITIENGFDPEIFRPMLKADARSRANLPMDEIVIGYFGTLRDDLGADVLVEAVRLLRNKHRNLRLILAGHDSSNLDFNGIDFIDYRGELVQESVPVLINSCDVVVIPYLKNRITEMCNACKCAEYLACKVPVVVTDVSDFRKVFAEIPQVVCPPGDPQALAVATDRQLAERSQASFPECWTWPALAKKLADRLVELISVR